MIGTREGEMLKIRGKLKRNKAFKGLGEEEKVRNWSTILTNVYVKTGLRM